MDDLKYLKKKDYMNMNKCPECDNTFLINYGNSKYCKNCKTMFVIRNFDDEPLTVYNESLGILMDSKEHEGKLNNILVNENGDMKQHNDLKSNNDYSINENGGVKDNKGKLRYEILDYEVMDEVVGQLTYGANKYPDPYNWKLVDPEEYIGAAGRHLSKFRQGEILDKDSGKHHLAAVIVNYMFALWHDLQKKKRGDIK